MKVSKSFSIFTGRIAKDLRSSVLKVVVLMIIKYVRYEIKLHVIIDLKEEVTSNKLRNQIYLNFEK